MKINVISFTLVVMLISSPLSHAGGNFSYGFGYNNSTSYGHGGYGGHYRNYGHRGYGNRGYGNRGYGNRGYGSLNFGYGHRSYGHSGNSDYVAGALILGGLIGYGINNLYHRSYRRNTYRHHYYNQDSYGGNTNSYRGYSTPVRKYQVNSAYVGQVVSPTRRLYRDRNGNCFEVRSNDRGEELRIALDQSECYW